MNDIATGRVISGEREVSRDEIMEVAGRGGPPVGLPRSGSGRAMASRSYCAMTSHSLRRAMRRNAWEPTAYP